MMFIFSAVFYSMILALINDWPATQIMNWSFHSVNKLASQPEDQAVSRQHILTNDPQKPLMKRSPPPCVCTSPGLQDNRTESLHVCLTSYRITHPICSLWLFIPRFWPFPSELQDIKSEMCEHNLSKIKPQLPFSFLSSRGRNTPPYIHSPKQNQIFYIDNEDCFRTKTFVIIFMTIKHILTCSVSLL